MFITYTIRVRNKHGPTGSKIMPKINLNRKIDSLSRVMVNIRAPHGLCGYWPYFRQAVQNSFTQTAFCRQAKMFCGNILPDKARVQRHCKASPNCAICKPLPVKITEFELNIIITNSMYILTYSAFLFDLFFLFFAITKSLVVYASRWPPRTLLTSRKARLNALIGWP